MKRKAIHVMILHLQCIYTTIRLENVGFGECMHPRKKQYVKEVHELTEKACRAMSENRKGGIPVVLKISTDDSEELISKIITALPDRQFYQATPAKLYDILAFIAKNYILFQVQEDIEDDNYANNLIAFLSSLSRNIDEKYYSEVR